MSSKKKEFLTLPSFTPEFMVMNILICPDKFKECMDAAEVAACIERGITKAYPQAHCRMIPMADGGEGTVQTLVTATQGCMVKARVHDPLMRAVDSFFGVSGDGKKAFIEMASASGLALLKAEERNPWFTTTFGTGELIQHALDAGCTEIIVGIGGSATVDGGVGMAQALGICFSDAQGNIVGMGGGVVGDIAHIDLSLLDPRIAGCNIHAAVDVQNPLTGKEGAACIYGPQKGADKAMVKKLDENLERLAGIIHKELHLDISTLTGGGAAGGLGAGLVAFLKGTLEPGFELVSNVVKLEEAIAWADLVITGEGRMDVQTAYGKTPAGIARLCRKQKNPVVAITGSLEDQEKLYEMGFAALIPIADKPMTLEKSMADAAVLLEKAAERTIRIFMLGKNIQ
jgi:glycerate 2-kinase